MLVSLYFYGLPDKEGKYYWDRHWDQIEKDIYIPRQRIIPDTIISFDEWIKNYDLNRFTLEYFAYSKKGDKLVDYFIKLENIKNDLNKLRHETGINFDDKKIPHLNPSTHPEYQAFYSEETISIVAETFRSDIEAGGYIFEKMKIRRAKTGSSVFNYPLFNSERDFLLKQLDTKSQDFKNEKFKIHQKLNTIEKEKAELKEKLNTIEKEKLNQTKNIESLNIARLNLLKKCEKLIINETKLTSELKSLTNEQSNLIAECDRLKKLEKKLEADYSALNIKTTKIKTEAEVLKDKIAGYSKNIDVLRNENDRLQQKVKEKEKKINVLIALLRENKLSSIRSVFKKLPFQKGFLVQARKNQFETINEKSDLSRNQEINKKQSNKPETQATDNEKRIENVKKLNTPGVRLRRQDERILASKASTIKDWSKVGNLLKHDKQIKVVFINDMGFLWGAGIALRRQVESFLKAGHKVACIAWLQDNLENPYFDNKSEYSNFWKGIHLLPEIIESAGKSRDYVVETLTKTVVANDPDLVISGNFHGVGWGAKGWPLEVIEKLHRSGMPVVAYAHDCYWATGACAYTGKCSYYLSGCDGLKCIKPVEEYPYCKRSEIDKNWKYRQRVFSGVNPIPIATNSKWTNQIFKKRYINNRKINAIHYGINVENFQPIDKWEARELLGLPKDGTYIALGAVNIAEARKGGKDIEILLSRYERHNDITWLTFGHNSNNIGTKGFGIVGEEKVSLIFSASDIYVNLSKEEAFGQTLLEASACGCPIITYNGGGMTDVARDNQNAICAETGNLEKIIISIEQLRNSPDLMERLGQKGREIAVKEFSLDRQYENWKNYIKRLSE